MAERWQQWMPHDIDSWQGSANVQALSNLAYRAVHNLILDMWKQVDCALPTEDRELAKRSRVGVSWADCRDEVLEYFSDRTENGKITHRVTFKKWNEAREVYEKRQSAAKKTNAQRSAHGDRDGDRNAQPTVTAPKASRSADTGTRTQTSTGTSTEKKQKPSRDEREPDTRHTPCRVACEMYATHKRVTFVWDASEAKQLALILAAAPDLTVAQFQACLNNRAKSVVAHGERPREWLPTILKYSEAPLDQYGKPELARPSAASIGIFKPPESAPGMSDSEVEQLRARVMR